VKLTPDEIHVWLGRESLLDDASIRSRFDALLAADERERRDRMKFERGRNEQLLTRGMLREVLSRYAPDIAPGDWRFIRGDASRPSLAPPFDSTGLHFNIAHTAGLVVLAVGHMPRIGVDVEALGRKAPTHLADRYFSPLEVAGLHALAPEELPRRFFRLWTLKEAYLKAIGTGVAGGLGTMTFTLDEPGGIRFERAADPTTSRWAFREFCPTGFQVALAYLVSGGSAGPEPVLREYHPVNR
jgi:4'-phosphopantetheinyl transferase